MLNQKSPIVANSVVKTNILTYIRQNQIKQARLYRITGISRGVLNQNNGLSEENIRKFLTHFSNVNPTWLLTGEGPMERRLNVNAASAPEARVVDTKKMIPLIPTHLLADYLSKKIDPIVPSFDWYCTPLFSTADFLVQMQNAGMYPIYNIGDLLICRAVADYKHIIWNSVYVLVTEFGPIVKRVRRGSSENSFMLISEDAEFEPMELNCSDVKYLAVVMGVLRIG